MSGVELRQLSAFVSTADHGSFSAAARELGVVQPAVSQAVRRLEDDLGLVLLTRTTRQVTLTAEGEELLPQARAIVLAERALRERARALITGSAGVVRLATTSGTAVLVRDLVAAFTQRHPEARIRLHRANRASKLDALRSGEIDAALVRELPAEPGISAVAADVGAWLVVCSPSHPVAGVPAVALELLARYPFVALSRPGARGSGSRGPVELRRAAAACGIELRTGPSVSSLDELLATVAAAPAWTLLTDTTRPQLTSLGLAGRLLDTPIEPPRVWLAHRTRTDPLTAALVAVADELGQGTSGR